MFRQALAPALTIGGLLAVAAAGLSGSSASAITNCDTAEAGVSSAEQQMLTLFNGARATAGAAPLKFSPNLNRAAAWKSEDSSAAGTGFSHTDSLGRDTVKQPPKNRAMDCGYAAWASEDIAYGSSDPTTIFGLWMNSAGHRANILDRNAVVVGLGEHNGRWTADFGSIDDSGSGTPPTPPAPTTPPTTPPTATPTPSATWTPTATPTQRPSPTATTTQTPQSGAGVAVQLYRGMNLVTFAGPAESVAAATASLGRQLVAVYAWNPASGRWERYAPGIPAYAATISSLEPGQVYFVELATAATWSY